jgi:hypothetical protein
MAKSIRARPTPKAGPTKKWLVTVQGEPELLQIMADVVAVTEAGLVFTLADGTVEWALPPGSWLRLQSANYPDG